MAVAPSKKRRQKRGAIVAHLSLVSLMDMFTIILIFLLHSFSATGETFTTTDKFQLPVSTATTELRPRLKIQITQDAIILEGKTLGNVEEIRKSGDMLIKPLYDELKEEARKSLFIAGVNPAMALSREVVILGDRSIPFVLLEKVMYTCGQVGYNNITLAVISIEG